MNSETDDNSTFLRVPMMEGSIKLGPIQGAKGRDILAAMLSHNLQIPRDEGAAYSARVTREGFVIQAEGPGVFGYLVDADGLEASDTDLEWFAKPLLERGGKIVIEGSHLVDPNVKVICRTTIEPDPKAFSGVRVTSWKTRVGAGIGVDHEMSI